MQTDFYEISKQTIRLYWDTSVIYNIGLRSLMLTVIRNSSQEKMDRPWFLASSLWSLVTPPKLMIAEK